MKTRTISTRQILSKNNCTAFNDGLTKRALPTTIKLLMWTDCGGGHRSRSVFDSCSFPTLRRLQTLRVQVQRLYLHSTFADASCHDRCLGAGQMRLVPSVSPFRPETVGPTRARSCPRVSVVRYSRLGGQSKSLRAEQYRSVNTSLVFG